MEEHEAHRKRGPGTLTLVLAGAGAMTALAGIGLFLRQRSSKKNHRNQSVRGLASAVTNRVPSVSLPTMDLEQARERAAALVNELSLVGQRGTSRARQIIHDVDLERARKAATDAASALADASRNAVAAAPVAIDRRKLAKRGKRAAKSSRSSASKLLAAMLFIASRLAGRKKKAKRGGLFSWRG